MFSIFSDFGISNFLQVLVVILLPLLIAYVYKFGAMDVSQSAAYIQSLTYENGFLNYSMDIPKSDSPLWILGVNYSALYDLEDIKLDITSRLWFTYRKGFAPIDVKAGNYLKRRLRLKKQALNCLSCHASNPHGKGPISDNGWGCMLRCGQMMLAQALINRHIGRDWRWVKNRSEPKYEEILKCFLDRKESCFSIHQIACMGVSESKKIGSWFGPNTIAHVMRKLACFDTTSNIVIHVAMDNTVITNDIKSECSCKCRSSTPTDSVCSSRRSAPHLDADSHASSYSHAPSDNHAPSVSCSHCTDGWRPLLLMIPLRLGLSDINEIYYEALKFCLTMSQSVGIIGGKPNHAYWFIGHIDNNLIYLDPHLTQNCVDISEDDVPHSDETYHCNYVSRMSISEMDPSLAMGFFCHTEAQFDDWQRAMNNRYNETKASSMFEVVVERPKHWPSIHHLDSNDHNSYAHARSGLKSSEYIKHDLIEANRHYDSTDEEFELI